MKMLKNLGCSSVWSLGAIKIESGHTKNDVDTTNTNIVLGAFLSKTIPGERTNPHVDGVVVVERSGLNLGPGSLR